MMAEGVIAALSHVQPAEAEEALLDLIDAEHEVGWLDAGWATEALAAAFPDTAAAMVDHWLKCARSHERVRALAALERLPAQLALPRLRLAASDPAFAVRDGARRQWLRRFDSACPVGAESALGAELLDQPPSDRFAARLAVMQGRVNEARRAMARALLAEAPDPEALVLLLQLVADDSDPTEMMTTRWGRAKRRWLRGSSSASGPSACAACARSRSASRSRRASGGCDVSATSSSAGPSRGNTRSPCARSPRGR